MVLGSVRFLRQHGKIEKPLIELFRYLFRIAAGYMITQARADILERPDGSGKMPDLVGFRIFTLYDILIFHIMI